MHATLETARAEHALALVDAGNTQEGDWVLAMFEIETGGRATAAAGRVISRSGRLMVSFEERDWQRLIDFATPRASIRAAETSARRTFTPRALRTLVVEDERISREMVTTFLKNAGIDVVASGSAEEAWEILATERFDLLVLDWTLPGMSGLDLCKQVRSTPSLDSVPILFLTANRSDDGARQAFSSGADDYIHKPIQVHEFRARVSALASRGRPKI